jgi:hypothetical protein
MNRPAKTQGGRCGLELERDVQGALAPTISLKIASNIAPPFDVA